MGRACQGGGTGKAVSDCACREGCLASRSGKVSPYHQANPEAASRGSVAVSGIKFEPGQIVATPGVLEEFRASGEDPLTYLVRHLNGDWGDLSADDVRENELSLEHGWRILSCYRLSSGVRIWLITEADRSVTTFLLPEEY